MEDSVLNIVAGTMEGSNASALFWGRIESARVTCMAQTFNNVNRVIG